MIIALDADEVISADGITSSEWQKMLQADIGTCFSFNLINITADFENYWEQKKFVRAIIADDNTAYHPKKNIHTEKVPFTASSNIVACKTIKILHYQYTDWNRMRSKHRWYMAWEKINNSHKNWIQLYRLYHHMYAVKAERLFPLKEIWFDGYVKRNIDMISVNKKNSYYWDKTVVNYFKQFGVGFFSKIDIWDIEWPGYEDPRTLYEKTIHRYLEITQKYSSLLPIKLIDKILKIFFK